MPKQQLILSKFEGGLHTDADPRDIKDNELSALKSISVSSIGLLKCMGESVVDTNISGLNADSTTGVIDLAGGGMSPGYGLFAFSSDYSSDGSLSSQDYLAFQDGDLVHIFGNGGWDKDNFASLVDLYSSGTTNVTNVEPSYYAPNADLRICDGNFSNVYNDPQWVGISGKKVLAEKDINGNTNNYGGNVIVGNSWFSNDAGIEANPFDNVGKSLVSTSPDANLVMHNGTIDGDGTSPTLDRTLSFFGTDSEVYSQATWGLGLGFSEQQGGDADAYYGITGDGHWQPDGHVKYRFYATVIYDKENDDIYQESHPKSFLMYGSQEDSSDDGLGEGDDEIQMKTVFADTHSAGTTGRDMILFFSPHLRINGDVTGLNGHYAFGNSSIIADGSTSGEEGNPRISGCRIYWASNENAYGSLGLIFDIDFVKGVKPYGMRADIASDWLPWDVHSATATGQMMLHLGDIGSNRWHQPPEIETYFTLNGYEHSTRLNAKWKTSVVVNERTYIANIKRQKASTFNGGGTWSTTEADDPVYQDRICFSPIGRFDTFPEDTNHDYSIGDDDDGDAIVKLEAFADRLLVFKKNTLYILNISSPEFPKGTVEATYQNLGLDFKQTSSKKGFQSQSFKTDFGVVWMNSGGVYIYDGQNVQSLTDNKIRNMWMGEDGYEPFFADDDDDVPAIGYDPKSKKIICSKTMSANGSDEEHLLVYDIKNKSWTYSENILTNGVHKTNFIIYKNELIWIEDNDASNLKVKYWNDVPADQTDIEIFTKDIDFKSPAVRKKIYKVYISYKGDGSALNVKYGVNGETDTSDLKQFSSSDNPLGDKNSTEDLESWHLAELKPTTKSEANNIYSFRLHISGEADSTFEINDITILYKVKPVK